MSAAARAAVHCGQPSNGSHHHHSRPSVIVPTIATPHQHHGLHSPENAAELLAGATTEDTAVTPTASVTPSAATRGQRTGMRTAGVASDPAIDEHFKRSLGLKDYAAVFNAATSDKETGLSVDDHFAKALGETWTRLQATTRSKDST
ncbi:transcription cofactor vestigial-like protein 4 isoform X3 [Copidosoma floridanum]|nr:transcription cofactor vestigial-like protein 4 isoform X3 [Copidosoma floridanum]